MINEHQSTFKTPSPPPPPYTSPVNSATNLTTSNTSNLTLTSTSSANNEEIKNLKQEIELLKEFTTKLSNDYKQLQIESKSQKQSNDEQLQKFQKKLKDLVEEIDEEKKTRLALQVELERIKKTLTHI
jgi:SH3 domain-containing kinase-binding protein 1